MKEIPVLSLDEIQEDRPMPSRNHSRIAQRLGVALAAYQDRYDIHQQISLELDGWASIPDLALFPVGVLPTDLLTDEDVTTVAPELVIEIVSPKQNLGPLADKVREFLHHGVNSCWIAQPITRVVSIFPAKGEMKSFTEGRVQDDALGISISLGDIFG